MKIRQKFFRVDNASTLQLTSDVDLISINTTAAVILQLPIDLPAGKQIKIKSLVAIPNVTIKSWNDSTLLTPTNEITIIEYTNQFVFTEIEEGGGGGDSGWSSNTTRTELNSDLGLSVSTMNGVFDYISIIDTSAGDVTIDLSPLEGIFTFFIKKFKTNGLNNIILESALGFSDGSNELIVSDYCFIVFDTYKWFIFQNNTVINIKIKTKKITNIDCQTWAAGVEIEPTKAGVIFMPMTAFLVAEDNHSELAKSSINQFSKGYSNNFVTSGINNLSLNQNTSFIYSGANNEEFKNDLYLFGQDFINPGAVTLYVTYQEITL